MIGGLAAVGIFCVVVFCTAFTLEAHRRGWLG